MKAPLIKIQEKIQKEECCILTEINNQIKITWKSTQHKLEVTKEILGKQKIII